MSSTSDPPSRPISEPVPSLLRSSASSLASEEWGRDEEGFGGQSSVQLNADNEDVMNVPCKFAPHRPHDLGSILSGARKPTSEEVERLKKRRAELERKIEEERLEHAHEEFPASEIQGLRGLSLVELQEKGVAVPLANGIAAVEPRELESLLGSNGKDEIVSRRLTRSVASTLISHIQTTEGKALSSSRFLVTDTPPRQRRAASPPDYDMSSSLHGASTLTTPSSNSSHIQSANTCYTPFTKTLHYFKQFTSTKNTPAKSRRNASLPEEIAELAKTARGEACEDNEDLDKYRGMDIGPLEPVMDDRWADNLIMLGSPGPRKTRRARYVVGEDKRRKPTCEMRDDVDSAEGTKYEFEIPGHFGDHVKMTNRTNAAAGQVASFIRQKGRGLEVSDEDTNEAVEVSGKHCGEPSNTDLRLELSR